MRCTCVRLLPAIDEAATRPGPSIGTPLAPAPAGGGDDVWVRWRLRLGKALHSTIGRCTPSCQWMHCPQPKLVGLHSRCMVVQAVREYVLMDLLIVPPLFFGTVLDTQLQPGAASLVLVDHNCYKVVSFLSMFFDKFGLVMIAVAWIASLPPPYDAQSDEAAEAYKGVPDGPHGYAVAALYTAVWHLSVLAFLQMTSGYQPLGWSRDTEGACALVLVMAYLGIVCECSLLYQKYRPLEVLFKTLNLKSSKMT